MTKAVNITVRLDPQIFRHLRAAARAGVSFTSSVEKTAADLIRRGIIDLMQTKVWGEAIRSRLGPDPTE